MAEFKRAMALRPNNSIALQFIAAVHRRQGRWNATLEELKRALDQDPRDANIASTIAETHLLLRNWKDAEEMARHSLAVDPHEGVGMHVLLLSSLNRTGDAEEPLRLRAALVETAWRLVRFQPQYRPVVKWRRTLAKGAMATGAARKKAIVAVARQLAVDLWRIRTGRVAPETLGLTV